MTGNFNTTSIITKGLHCGPADKGLITTRFSLCCGEAKVTPPPKQGGGGPYPGPAWNKTNNIQDFYRPVEPEIQYIPRDQEEEYLRKYKIVTLKINIGDINVEKIYKVPEQRRDVVVKVFNFIDVTQSRITATITKLKRITTRAKAIITKLRLK